jgi:hypothetical protein
MQEPPKTTRTYTLPDAHIKYLEQQSLVAGLTVDQMLARMIAWYQRTAGTPDVGSGLWAFPARGGTNRD